MLVLSPHSIGVFFCATGTLHIYPYQYSEIKLLFPDFLFKLKLCNLSASEQVSDTFVIWKLKNKNMPFCVPASSHQDFYVEKFNCLGQTKQAEIGCLRGVILLIPEPSWSFSLRNLPHLHKAERPQTSHPDWLLEPHWEERLEKYCLQ